jgi:predicted transposase YdaD
MTYYLTATSPLVFTTQKAEQVTESMITDMLELLLRREYEMYSPEEAAANVNYWIQADSLYREVSEVPQREPTQEQIQAWANEVMWFTEPGQRLRSQVGTPLHKQEASETFLTDETTLSDLMEGWTYPSEQDSAGPELHSRLSSPQSSEA